MQWLKSHKKPLFNLGILNRSIEISLPCSRVYSHLPQIFVGGVFLFCFFLQKQFSHFIIECNIFGGAASWPPPPFAVSMETMAMVPSILTLIFQALAASAVGRVVNPIFLLPAVCTKPMLWVLSELDPHHARCLVKNKAKVKVCRWWWKY